MGTQELQITIKRELKRIGWAVRKFSDEYYMDRNNIYHSSQIDTVANERQYQRIKKHLGRTYKNAEQLQNYLDFLTQVPDYNCSRVKPTYAPLSVLSEKMHARMYEISQELSAALDKSDLS